MEKKRFVEPEFAPAVFAPPNHNEESLYFGFRGDQLLVLKTESSATVPHLNSFSDVGIDAESQHYLGVIQATSNSSPDANLHCFAIDIADACDPPDGLSFHGLRQLFGLLDDKVFSVAGRAIQIVNWNRTHLFCGRCGHETTHHKRDRARECPTCGLISYPRVSPAVIMLIHRKDKFLLARNASFPEKRYSIIAGFVEAGENLEQAVVREIREEVGIEVKNVTYFGSQPWPFPHSLMVGFTAEYASGEIEIDGEEIIDAGWYTTDPDYLPELPDKISISRHIIDSFITAKR